MKIKKLILREVFDSRGEPTLEVALVDAFRNSARAQIPSGKSRGKNEAAVLSFKEAKKATQAVQKKISGKNFNSVSELDRFLIDLDSTRNKHRLGGNLMLGTSIAFLRLSAQRKKQEVWETLKQEFFRNIKTGKNPLIFSNLINGGAHAKNNLAIQEYLVVVKTAKSLNESVKKLIKLYGKLGGFLEKQRKLKNLPIGDEGGYSLDFKNNFQPIEILEKLIEASKLDNEFLLAMDAAASQFYKKGEYQFEGKRNSSGVLGRIYANYFQKSKLLFSIEDPFAENDVGGFQFLKGKLKYAWVVGDDLTATNPALIKKFGKERAIGGVIIKPNQIGTVSETCEAIKIAQKNHLKIIISHRSGETEDNFIIHLARASGADGLKIGAPARERISKFNELLRIYP